MKRLNALALTSLTLLCGCAGIVREQLNRRYPPVEPVQRQYAAIQETIPSLERMPPPDVLAFLSPRTLQDYITTVLASPIPLDAQTSKVLVASPEYSGIMVRLGYQDVILETLFNAKHVSGIIVQGRLEVHFSPELVAGGPNFSSGLRLRISVARPYIYRIDLSGSKYSGLQLLSESARSLIADTLQRVIDNVNGTIPPTIIPFASPPLVIGDEKPPVKKKINDLLTLTIQLVPPVIARVYPFLQNAAVVVQPQGISVFSTAGWRELQNGPVPAVPQPPEFRFNESLPPRAPSDIQLKKAIDDLVRDSTLKLQEVTGRSQTPDNSALILKSNSVARVVNAIIGQRSADIVGSGDLSVKPPPGSGDIRIPKIPLYCDDLEIVKCDGHKDVCSAQYAREAERIKNITQQVLNEGNKEISQLRSSIAEACRQIPQDVQRTVNECLSFNLWGCVSSATKTVTDTIQVTADPAECTNLPRQLDDLNNRLGVTRALQATADAALRDPEEHGLDLIDAVDRGTGSNLGQHYREVCGHFNEFADHYGCEPLQKLGKAGCEQVQKALDHFQGDKVGDVEWDISGSGDKPVSFTLHLSNLNLADDLGRLAATASGDGAVNLSGHFKIHLEDAFRIALCTSGQALEGNVGPAKIEAQIDESTLTGPITLEKGDDGYSRLLMQPNSVKVSFKSNVPPMQLLMKIDNVLFPCATSNFAWSIMPLYKILEWTKVSIPYSQEFDPGKLDLARLEPEVELPVSWKLDPNGQLKPDRVVAIPVTYSLADGVFQESLGQLPIPPKGADIPVPKKPIFAAVAAGLSTAEVFGEPIDNRPGHNEVGRGLLWMFPYAKVNLKTQRVGILIGAQVPMLGLRSAGFIAGADFNPWPKLPDLGLFAGGRVGVTRGNRGATVAIGIAWDVGKLCVWGCGL